MIIGLGNPDKKYHSTPHNIGRSLVEEMARKKVWDWREGKWFDWTESNPALIRLHSYMNLSGEAILKSLHQFGCEPKEILICADDFDLPLETIRIRKKGSAGSHNGLKSVIQHLQTEEFPRLRLGIGPLDIEMDPASFVCTPFPASKKNGAAKAIEKAQEAVEMIISDGLDAAMNRFNTRTS